MYMRVFYYSIIFWSIFVLFRIILKHTTIQVYPPIYICSRAHIVYIHTYVYTCVYVNLHTAKAYAACTLYIHCVLYTQTRIYIYTYMRTQRRVWHMAGGNVQSLTSCVIMMYQGTAHPGTAHPGIELFIDPSSSRFYY